MKHTIASAILAGYYIKLTKFGDKYQVDYGADSQQFDSFTDATQAFKQALCHAGALEGLTDEFDTMDIQYKATNWHW